MAKVDTNTIALNYARQAAAGKAKPAAGWRGLEPNEISQFGAAISTVAREPISDRLQRRKGTVTDLDSSVAFTADLTVDGLLDWIEAAIFAKGFNAIVRSLAVEAAATAADQYTLVDAMGAAQIAKLKAGALLWAYGFVAEANNGLKRLDTDAAAGDVLAVDENLVNVVGGTAAKPAGYVTLAGYRVAGGTEKTWTWDVAAKRATLAIAGDVETTDLDEILAPGMTVHFGSVTAAGQNLGNGLFITGAGDTEAFGFARVQSISNAGIVFDRVDENLQTGGAADSTNALDIIAGDFIRNVPRSDSLYVQQAHTLEQVSAALIDPTPETDDDEDTHVPGYEYAVGQVVASLALDFPLTDKATMTVNLVGEDVEPPVKDRTAGAAAALAPVRGEAINTSADFARLRITKADDDGVTTDFKSMGITINAQATPEKILGALGAAGGINRGNLLVDVEAQVIFSSEGVLEAIRNNRTVRFDVIVGNNEGVFVFEVPSATLGGGGREYPANAAVLMNTSTQAFEDEDYQTSIHVSFMPVPIPIEGIE